jgi:hypothetical protein
MEAGFGGLALVLFGLLAICQVTKGSALTRLGLTE